MKRKKFSKTVQLFQKVFDKLLRYTKTFFLKIHFFAFLANFIFQNQPLGGVLLRSPFLPGPHVMDIS